MGVKKKRPELTFWPFFVKDLNYSLINLNEPKLEPS
ncbi:MAG: hypothetical protein ACJAY8_000284, partial [Sphingobacteriales bacterium]